MNRQNNIRRERESLNGIKELYNLILTYENNEQEDTHKLVLQLLEYQKADGSFCVTEKCPTESDSRIHYYYEPTYYGAAALMHAMLSDCGKADKKKKKALNRALPVVMQRELVGHGYDATRQQLDALKIFKDAGLYEWMSRFEESLDTTTRDFCAMIRKIISGYREAVLSGRTFSDWNVDFRKDFEKELDDYEEGLIPYIWYASYGSNISSARFQEYLQRCGGNVAETESRPYTTQGTLYFAAESDKWGRGKGVAFFDETASGKVLMRIYKITRDRFRDVQRMEGPKYSRRVTLGFIDDVPVYTFTSPEKREDIHAPSLKYVQTILKGLKEIHSDVPETVLLAYLFKHGAISDDARKVLTFIRRAPHAVTINELADDNNCPGLTRTKEAVRFLAGIGLIRQDAGSRRAGHAPTDGEAKYFTEPEKRDIIFMLVNSII